MKGLPAFPSRLSVWNTCHGGIGALGTRAPSTVPGIGLQPCREVHDLARSEARWLRATAPLNTIGDMVLSIAETNAYLASRKLYVVCIRLLMNTDGREDVGSHEWGTGRRHGGCDVPYPRARGIYPPVPYSNTD